MGGPGSGRRPSGRSIGKTTIHTKRSQMTVKAKKLGLRDTVNIKGGKKVSAYFNGKRKGFKGELKRANRF